LRFSNYNYWFSVGSNDMAGVRARIYM
jgi:hypothetical protein